MEELVKFFLIYRKCEYNFKKVRENIILTKYIRI